MLRRSLPLMAVALLMWPGTAAQSSSFQELFARYRGSDAAAAIVEFADWNQTRVDAEAQLSASQLQDPWSAAALALFHLEADLHRWVLGKDLKKAPVEGDVGVVKPPIHVYGAKDLVEVSVIPAAKSTGDRPLLDFCRDWYVAVNTAWPDYVLAHYLPYGEHQLGGRQLLLESTLRHLADSADIHLLAGIQNAWLMGPLTNGDSTVNFGTLEDLQGPDAMSVGKLVYLRSYARTAEQEFRRALTLSPSLAEARLRLGRLYQVLNRAKDAQTELERGRTEAAAQGDLASAYLAGLFLGDLHVQAGRVAEGVAAYQQAIRIYPAGMAARLALGDALLMLGETEAGWQTVRDALGPDTARTLRDPWTYYGTVGYWQLAPRLAAMRRQVSKTPLELASPAFAKALTAADTSTPPSTKSLPVTGPVFRGGVEGVRVDVLAMDGDVVVDGLTAKDFFVTDNGVGQAVTRVTTAGSLSLALVVDTSASMNSAVATGFSQLAMTAIQRALLDTDRVAVLTAGDRVRLQTDLVPNGDALRSALSSSYPGIDDRTTIWDAAFAASSLVVSAPGRPLVMVISDGHDNASWLDRRRTLDRLQRRGVAVDGIKQPVNAARAFFDFAYGDINLREPAKASGGVAFDVEDPALVAKIAARFAALRNSYILLYSRENAASQKDGWHEIKVTLRPGVKGKVQARPGYYAPAVKK